MLCIFYSVTCLAVGTQCLDPNNSPLAWGEIPPPWMLNPYSEQRPIHDLDTHFVKANILVAGLGRGVLCTYQNSQGFYSIWWEVNVKIPARTDYVWRDTLGGFECTETLEECIFYPSSLS